MPSIFGSPGRCTMKVQYCTTEVCPLARALTDFVIWSCVDYLPGKGSYRVVLGKEVQFVKVDDLTNLRFVGS